MEALAACMDASFKYVGLMGPRVRCERMLKDLSDKGIVPGSSFMAQFHSPMGLDIGSETSQEVALSILAELQAVKRSRSGGLLRDSLRTIHDRM
jgi:xanthine dehydrogenase accessory factor